MLRVFQVVWFVVCAFGALGVGAATSAVAFSSHHHKTTTTTTATTTTSGAPTYASQIAYTNTRPAFTAIRTIGVKDAASLRAAITNLRPGDLVKATAPFTVSVGGSANGLVIARRLTAPAVIDLTGVSIIYTGGYNFNGVWIRNILNIRIYGGNISTNGTGGSCIGWTGSQHSLWWGFYAHDCGSGGMGIFTAPSSYSYAGPVEYNDIQGEVAHFSLNHGKFDPHAEKCTGVHGANLSDSNWYAFDHNRIALNVHDSPCTGGGISFGSNKSSTTSPSGPIPTTNTIYLKCANLTFVSTIQTGGNCYQTWGYGNRYTDIKYLQADNLTGHPYWAGGLYNKTSAGATYLTTDVVDYARATNVRQNSLYARDSNYDKRGGTVFRDVSPLP